MEITLDTHSLIWHVDERLNHLLSKEALKTITEAENSGVIYIPVIVLTEILHITEKKRIHLDFNTFLNEIENSNVYRIVPLDIEIIKISMNIKGQEMHDRLILATAICMKTPLVSKDTAIASGGFKTIW